MSEISVTNTSSDELTDFFDGEAYTFPPKKAVKVPVDVAHHIFGYNERDKRPWVTRLGWSQTNNDMPEGLKRLARFKFEPEETRPSLSPGAERVPLSSPKSDGGKLAIASA